MDALEKLAFSLWLKKAARDQKWSYRLLYLLMMANVFKKIKERSEIESLCRKIAQVEDLKWREQVQSFWLFYKNNYHYDEILAAAKSCFQQGIYVVNITDVFYPYLLRQIYQCPIFLFCKGVDLLQLYGSPFWIAVIGSRNPSAYGSAASQKIARHLALQDVVVVSGLAYGIDALAHASCTKLGKPTVAVLGSGLNCVYPKENHRLFEEIQATGMVCSEYLPEESAKKYYFPERNRIISGLCQATVIVEASQKSGTLITANHALEQGREVFAVPGSILQNTSLGCHHLIKDGATIVSQVSDILANKSIFQVHNAEKLRSYFTKQNLPQAELKNFIPSDGGDENKTNYAIFCQGLDEEQNHLLKAMIHCMKGRELSLTEIALELNERVEKIAVQLSFLEMKGWLFQKRGRYFLTY